MTGLQSTGRLEHIFSSQEREGIKKRIEMVEGLTRKIFTKMKEKVQQEREEKRRKEELKRPPPEWLHGTMQTGSLYLPPGAGSKSARKRASIDMKSRTIYLSQEARRDREDREEYEEMRRRKQEARERRRKEGRKRIGLDYLSLLKTVDAGG